MAYVPSVVYCIVTCRGVRVTKTTGSRSMIRFIGTSITCSLNQTQLYRYRYSTHFQFTVAHALGFSVSTSRLLAMDLNTETSTSDQSEVLLPFLIQSP
jgi:hypothetical protein